MKIRPRGILTAHSRAVELSKKREIATSVERLVIFYHECINRVSNIPGGYLINIWV